MLTFSGMTVSESSKARKAVRQSFSLLYNSHEMLVQCRMGLIQLVKERDGVLSAYKVQQIELYTLREVR